MIQEAESYFVAFEQSLLATDSTLILCAQTCCVQPRPTDKPAPEKLAYIHLYNDVKEIQSWLFLLLHEQRLLWDSKLRIQPHDIMNHSPTLVCFLDELRVRVEKMRLYLKAVYAWLYHVEEDIKGSRFLTNQLNKPVKDELARYCLFRHSMMTHKKMESYPLNHVMPNDEPSEFRLLMVPYGFRQDVRKEFNDIFRQCFPTAHVPDDDASFALDQVTQLAGAIGTLPRDLARKANIFLIKHGTCSEPPLPIAQFIERLAKEVVLPLATDIGST